jgi:hypothetical protein
VRQPSHEHRNAPRGWPACIISACLFMCVLTWPRAVRVEVQGRGRASCACAVALATMARGNVRLRLHTSEARLRCASSASACLHSARGGGTPRRGPPLLLELSWRTADAGCTASRLRRVQTQTQTGVVVFRSCLIRSMTIVVVVQRKLAQSSPL